MLETIFKLILCHLVGDYLFQTPYLAETKGSNWYHLFVHCMLYALPFYLCFGWCWQLAVVTGLHFPIDLAKARYHKIGALTDQLLHYGACLVYLLYGFVLFGL